MIILQLSIMHCMILLYYCWITLKNYSKNNTLLLRTISVIFPLSCAVYNSIIISTMYIYIYKTYYILYTNFKPFSLFHSVVSSPCPPGTAHLPPRQPTASACAVADWESHCRPPPRKKGCRRRRWVT